MNKLARNLLTLMLVGSVLMVYGCAEDEEGGLPTKPEARNWRDLVVTLNNMNSHVGQLIAFRVVSKFEDITTVWDELRCVARINTLQDTVFTFTMPLAVPEGVHRLDFWCDNNGNGWVDPSEPGDINDHSYRVMIPATGTATVTFDHPDAAADTLGAYWDDGTWFIDTNQPTWVRPPAHFWMNFTAMDSAVGHILELQVVDPDNDRTVGYYRFDTVAAAEFQVVLPSIGYLNTDGTGKAFQIDLYVDLDDSGGFSAGDDSWSVTGTTGTYNDTLGAGVVVPVADSLVVNFAGTATTSTIVWP
jgi:hypothetical protein